MDIRQVKLFFFEAMKGGWAMPVPKAPIPGLPGSKSYGGWYDKRVIPFLKSALARNYNKNVFMGRRGPERLEGDDHTLQYLNRVEQNDFASFEGYEQIITTSEQWIVPVGTKLGEHHYFGGVI